MNVEEKNMEFLQRLTKLHPRPNTRRKGPGIVAFYKSINQRNCITYRENTKNHQHESLSFKKIS